MSSLTKPFRNRVVVLLMLVVTALMIIFIFWPSSAAAQCSMCRAVVGSNLESGDGARGLGINNAILYLMAAPYILAMIVIYGMFGDKIRAWIKAKLA